MRDMRLRIELDCLISSVVASQIAFAAILNNSASKKKTTTKTEQKTLNWCRALNRRRPQLALLRPDRSTRQSLQELLRSGTPKVWRFEDRAWILQTLSVRAKEQTGQCATARVHQWAHRPFAWSPWPQDPDAPLWTVQTWEVHGRWWSRCSRAPGPTGLPTNRTSRGPTPYTAGSADRSRNQKST